LVPVVGVIGGTGVYSPEAFGPREELRVATPYGEALLYLCHFTDPSGLITDIYFLPRHGTGHSVAPHLINYRANILALRQVGVRRVFATSAVGSLDPARVPGSFGLITQFLDFTRARPHTFADTAEKGVYHIDFTHPYCSELGALLLASAAQMGLPMDPEGCYVCVEGPRYETAAEIRAFRILGGDYVGMTGCPEVMLAREAGLCYASVAIVANLGAGMAEGSLTHEEVVAIIESSGKTLQGLILGALTALPRSDAALPRSDAALPRGDASLPRSRACSCPDREPAV
jgi:5'-methylthioadenosine phosphorylase